jgi:hypothetical protein
MKTHSNPPLPPFDKGGWGGFVILWPWKDFFVQPANVFIR